MGDLPVDSRANVTVLPQPHYLVAKEKKYEALKESHGEAWEMGLFTHVLPYVSRIRAKVADDRSSRSQQGGPAPRSPQHTYILSVACCAEQKVCDVLPAQRDASFGLSCLAMGP